MVKFAPDNLDPGSRETFRVIMLYQDTASREFAANSSKEWSEPRPYDGLIEVRWVQFNALAQDDGARELAQCACAADLVVFAARRAGEWPDEIKRWIENWIPERGEREGAIVGILMSDAPSGPVEIASLKEIYLRNAAHRAGMDYLSEMPLSAVRAIPDSLDSYSARAGQITSFLAEILKSASQQPTLRR